MSFERNPFLHRWYIGRAEEAFAFLDGLGIYFSSRRNDTCRIELYLIRNTVYIQFLHLHIAEGGIIVTCRFPGGKLLDE